MKNLVPLLCLNVAVSALVSAACVRILAPAQASADGGRAPFSGTLRVCSNVDFRDPNGHGEVPYWHFEEWIFEAGRVVGTMAAGSVGLYGDTGRQGDGPARGRGVRAE